ncbi:menaquinone-dependent protoporphyrinogen IX dehydrogenase [uncultured Cohaesibacter sp.]|uniref:menaquinone-dependent protoporphyrinogen IX dehydrogenase n=1 Tax=uncultured Cohaesibacter sp. TaxID=1002546 RepID=UPI0029303269|nr:menaquinone-dependent protoporphyrinogen IX dehydrogenase [uncultured Cohaesibacter sp.]
MADIALFFASRDGQARKIALALDEFLDRDGADVMVTDLGEGMTSDYVLGSAQVVVVVAAIRYGRHLRAADEFLKKHKNQLQGRRLVLISVSLTARKPAKRLLENSLYLQKWVKLHSVTPDIVTAVGGRVDYPSYDWFSRTMIRLIMTITKGPTDPNAQIEFTDWDQVKDLASKIAALIYRP